MNSKSKVMLFVDSCRFALRKVKWEERQGCMHEGCIAHNR